MQHRSLIKCRKYRRPTEEQRMGDLPQDRMETTPPFAHAGIDCFGPIYIKEGRKELKKHGLVLTCLCLRAIHLEMLDNMTSDAFVNALKAFIAIRGNVHLLRCDQGTNVVGARRENSLKQWCQTDPVKGHVAAGFHSNQARTHLIQIRCVLAVTWPSTGSV